MDILHLIPVLLCGTGISTLLILGGQNLLRKKDTDYPWKGNTLRKMEKQVPLFLDAVSSNLSSGNSLLQSLEAAAEKSDPPLETLIQRLITGVRAGMSLERALKKTAGELNGGSLLLVLHSMAASYRSGGNMVQSLSLLASICREREALQEKIQARTAQSRMQGTVLTIVPVLFLILLFLTSPQNLLPVLYTSVGRKFLFAAALLQGMGILVIRKMLRQEIL